MIREAWQHHKAIIVGVMVGVGVPIMMILALSVFQSYAGNDIDDDLNQILGNNDMLQSDVDDLSEVNAQLEADLEEVIRIVTLSECEDVIDDIEDIESLRGRLPSERPTENPDTDSDTGTGDSDE